MTNEMHNSYNQFLFHSFFCLLYMFRTNRVVHHQQHGIIYCITQFGTIGTIVQASLAEIMLLLVDLQKNKYIFNCVILNTLLIDLLSNISASL
jgi:predicted polyphosphate/ATP-dependent NAD kinase